MSIHFSGALKRSNGLIAAISKQLKSVNLKGVKRITVTFDPFAENVRPTRDFLSLLSAPKISLTNPNCVLKTDVVCNRQPAQVKFSLIDSAQEKVQVKEIRFISENLTTLELLQLLNKHVSALAPVEEITSKVATKAEKQKLAAGGKKGSKRK
ncbi:39S ribosomal protein L53, mitochondrial-like [Rhagoletis pomonella]|uniref:39S ribosomal protein L53, mitochondrial-like n=1 Tax=Rhagoletis pomonella TaxID=28610 RepID=UPI0017863773|nr:39S ribosomal protein L53, mitochondrial-like [Rhagoletis pomonella]XP_036317515.1 39S ribosomal protein L53, mitochondrial-like [Rhagoletis pomonella]